MPEMTEILRVDSGISKQNIDGSFRSNRTRAGGESIWHFSAARQEGAALVIFGEGAESIGGGVCEVRGTYIGTRNVG